jgi:predicted nucleic acid-binding protein
LLAISDSSPLIALAQIEQLDLIRRLHTKILVPAAVAREVAPTIPQIPAWCIVRPLTGAPRPCDVSAAIGLGEREAISLALEVKADRLIVDEQPARRLAASLGLRVIGTVGLLLAAKERGFITEVRHQLDRLLNARFFIDEDLYRRVLAQAGE